MLLIFPYLHGVPPDSGNVIESLRYALRFDDSSDYTDRMTTILRIP